MKIVIVFAILLTLAATILAQGPTVQTLSGAQKEFEQVLAKGAKQAFLEYLASDAVVFEPEAVNGKVFWTSKPNSVDGRIVRRADFVDVSSNGIVGYTTGKWERFTKGKDLADQFGQFVTVWVKRQGGRFQIAIDITTNQDDDFPMGAKSSVVASGPGDLNKGGWSAADPSMNFLKTAMGGSRLGGAYQQWAADEIRLIREGDPPIFGKKKVVDETQDYQSISYPKRVVLNEAADLAYVWNPCEYANSDEGIEKGNCLHIWKLREKKWWIVLGMLSRVRNDKRPALKIKQNKTKN